MKPFLFFLTFFLTVNCVAQSPYYDRWVAMAKSDFSLQPEYGEGERTTKQKESDEEFEKDILQYYKGDREAAGKKMVALGFTYLYDKGDFVTAMRRFNQAFLLDRENADIYYGYGTVYFNLGALGEARKQYDKGLKINPRHSEILTDYGTTFLGDYYNEFPVNKGQALENLIMASNYLDRSLAIDDQNSNTIYKLSIVNMYLGDCEKANSFLARAKAMKNSNVTESYVQELKGKCSK